MTDEPVVEPDAQKDSDRTRRIVGRIVGASIVGGAAIAVAATLLLRETRPQTDDATVRANFIGIAPQVSGHIVELKVRDHQPVNEGDLLFQVDPRPYEIALERVRAALALTRNEVDGLKNGAATAAAGIARAKAQLDASSAEVARLETQLKHADDHLRRLEPLLPR